MTTVDFLSDDKKLYKGFEANGHAGSGEYGKDIVCAAVSALMINTVNSLDELTDAHITVESDEKKGFLKLLVEDHERDDVQLLLSSLYLGLSDIRDENQKYLKLTNRRY